MRIKIPTLQLTTVLLSLSHNVQRSLAFQVTPGIPSMNTLLAPFPSSFERSSSFTTSTKSIHKYSSITAFASKTANQAEEEAAVVTNNDNDEIKSVTWQARKKGWRPTVQDVENISWGKPAKKKGTGSRGVPHRLNHEDERKAFDQGRRKGFLEVAGSGWRSTRRDAPLVNSYRSLCDARSRVCIILHKGNTGLDDEVVLDISPLRLPEDFNKLENDVLAYVDTPFATSFNSVENSSEEGDDFDEEEDLSLLESDEVDDAWINRPIYQLPPICITWELPRSEAKSLGKKLADAFDTADSNATKSKKPKNKKHGKGRRSGGYGIG